MRILALALMTICLPAAAVAAADPVVSINAANTPVTEVAQTLTRQAGVSVLADTAQSTTFSGSFSNMPLEDVLDYVAKASELKWRKIYVAPDTEQDKLLEIARKQAALVDQLAVQQTAVVYDPATKKQVTVTVAEVDPAQTVDSAQAMGLKPVYLISSAKAAVAAATKPVTASADPNATAYAQIDRQRDVDFLAMSPEQRMHALEQSMLNDIARSPTERQAIAQARRDAYNALRQSNSPAYQQWRDMHRDMWRGDRGGRDRGR